jgi:HlyD family secretion protein
MREDGAANSMANRRWRFRWPLLALLVVAAGLFIRWDRQRSVQVIRTAKVEREDIQAGVITNGKAEAIQYRDVRSEIEGEVVQVLVHDGDRIQQGRKLIQISQREIPSEVEHARAELRDAEEALRLLKQGGTSLEIRELEVQRDLAKRDQEQAVKLVAQNERLVEKGAIARIELEQSRNRLAKAEADLSVVEQKLHRRYDPEEIARAEARVQADQAALNLAESRLRSTTVSSPLQGVVYSVPVRAGDYVRTGDVLARVGDLRQIRVRVYVDEPDLGKVAKAQQVLVTWDGLPGKQWRGEVDGLPSEVKELGTRRVGEISCILMNPEQELLPNMNLNVEIVTDSKRQVLTIPREALLGSGSAQHVYLVRDGTLVKQPVRTGITNTTRIEITQGLKEGDEVAGASETPLREGMRVRSEAG